MGTAYSKEAEFFTLTVTVPKLEPVTVENVSRTTAYTTLRQLSQKREMPRYPNVASAGRRSLSDRI